MSKHKHNHYGTFSTKNPWYFRRRNLTIAGITAVLILTLTVGFKLFKSEQVLEIPQAEATNALPAWWLTQYFGISVCESTNCAQDADLDYDKLTNAHEFYYHTDPLNAHTIGDKLTDGELVAAGFDPSRSGRMSFEEVVHEDNILGESLLVDQDIEDLVAEANDVNKVPLPIVKDDELQIVNRLGAEVNDVYVTDVVNTVNDFFPNESLEEIVLALKSGSKSELSDIQTKSKKLVMQLRKLPVPQQMLSYHKHIINFYDLLGKVLAVDQSGLNINSPQSDVWFADSQALLASAQKLNTEQERIQPYLNKTKQP